MWSGVLLARPHCNAAHVPGPWRPQDALGGHSLLATVLREHGLEGRLGQQAGGGAVATELVQAAEGQDKMEHTVAMEHVWFFPPTCGYSAVEELPNT